MPEWVPCHKCGYWFLPDNDKKNYKVVQFQGQIVGAICPHCANPVRNEEKN